MKTTRNFLLSAASAALAFTLSCSGSDDSQGETASLPEYAYCVYVAERICVDGPFTACTGGGTLGNSCPFQASTPSSSGGAALPSSNSAVPSSNSVAASSSSVAPSSNSVAASSSSAVPSSSSVAASSSSATLSSNSTIGDSGTFIDGRDGKVYKWVKIGTQVWMAENLNYAIASGSWCYNEQASYCETYGRLYDWATARAACPSGWHLPSNAEWDALSRCADGTSGTDSFYNSPTAGRKLKATSGWNDIQVGRSGNGTDDFGFSALPGGFRDTDGSFIYAGDGGLWWSASEYDASRAYYRDMHSSTDEANLRTYDKAIGFSIRCLQD